MRRAREGQAWWWCSGSKHVCREREVGADEGGARGVVPGLLSSAGAALMQEAPPPGYKRSQAASRPSRLAAPSGSSLRDAQRERQEEGLDECSSAAQQQPHQGSQQGRQAAPQAQLRLLTRCSGRPVGCRRAAAPLPASPPPLSPSRWTAPPKGGPLPEETLHWGSGAWAADDAVQPVSASLEVDLRRRRGRVVPEMDRRDRSRRDRKRPVGLLRLCAAAAARMLHACTPASSTDGSLAFQSTKTEPSRKNSATAGGRHGGGV